MRHEYQEMVKELFNADVCTLSGDAEPINKRCAEKTQGLVPHVDSISPDLVLLLVNAIYFKGTWKDKFEEELTTKVCFFPSPR